HPRTRPYAGTPPGDTPLSSATLSDDKCSSVTFVSGDSNSDGKLDPGETWSYSCQTTALHSQENASHQIVNTATAGGTDLLGKTVTDTASHTTLIIHPAIQVVKSGPATAHDGDTLSFTYAVTNTGDTPLTSVTL